jgi:hypothetical protein
MLRTTKAPFWVVLEVVVLMLVAQESVEESLLALHFKDTRMEEEKAAAKKRKAEADGDKPNVEEIREDA